MYATPNNDPLKSVPVIPAIQKQVEHIEKMLCACHEAAGRLERVYERLTGPLPASTGKDAAQPAADNLAQKLVSIGHMADGLLNRLSCAAEQFDAVI